MSEISCQVCAEKFENEQGKGGHIASLKDAAHVSYRTLGALPAKGPEPSPEAAVKPAAEPPVQPPSPAADPAPSPAPTPEPLSQPQAPASSPMQQEAEPLAGFLPVSFEPPEQIQPLAANPQPTGSTQTSKPPAVVVPLEPILAGTTLAALNGLVLNRPIDAQLTLAQVRETGFPRAAEACVRHYYPDLPLDHPVTALLLSGANLAMLVAACRGKYENQTPPTDAKPDAASPQPEPEEPAVKPEGPTGTTGDPYWDAILAKAGGVAL